MPLPLLQLLQLLQLMHLKLLSRLRQMQLNKLKKLLPLTKIIVLTMLTFLVIFIHNHSWFTVESSGVHLEYSVLVYLSITFWKCSSLMKIFKEFSMTSFNGSQLHQQQLRKLKWSNWLMVILLQTPLLDQLNQTREIQIILYQIKVNLINLNWFYKI